MAGASGASFPLLASDLGMLIVGLTCYGAVFAWVGLTARRPLLSGLFLRSAGSRRFCCFRDYLKRLTVAYYLQALVPHAMPQDSPVSVLMQVFYATFRRSERVSCGWRSVVAAALWFAARTVETREYVLEQ